MTISENNYASPANEDRTNFTDFGIDVWLDAVQFLMAMKEAMQDLNDTIKEELGNTVYVFSPPARIKGTRRVVWGSWVLTLTGRNENGPIWNASQLIGRYRAIEGVGSSDLLTEMYD